MFFTDLQGDHCAQIVLSSFFNHSILRPLEVRLLQLLNLLLLFFLLFIICLRGSLYRTFLRKIRLSSKICVVTFIAFVYSKRTCIAHMITDSSERRERSLDYLFCLLLLFFLLFVPNQHIFYLFFHCFEGPFADFTAYYSKNDGADN